jgi:aminodeoxyfutalosine synthase
MIKMQSFDIPRKLFPDGEIGIIAEKVFAGGRITAKNALSLFRQASLGQLSLLSEQLSYRLNGKNVYFIRNFHIEPTNICVYHCRFCSYSQKANESGGWELTMEEVSRMVADSDPEAKEVHITGGAHPEKGVEYYGDLIRTIKKLRPEIHIKAFSAVEIHHLHELSGTSYESILKYLKDCGLGSIPGGGAEIFYPDIRKKICPEKVDATGWLKIHETAHLLGLPSGSTMLYGHIEDFEHRVDHMEKIRQLQDKTGGFRSFIPLKFRNLNNTMSSLPEIPLLEDLRNYAVSRIFFDNIQHIKAYWPMLGKNNAQLSLFFGVDDLDGTIEDSTKIYSLAGVSEKAHLTADEMSEMIIQAGKDPVKRDALYNTVKT